MNKHEIIDIIEKFAPTQNQESWDCSGWAIENYSNNQINNLMLCLTITQDVINQAIEKNCEMIVSHHPMFYVELNSNAISDSYKPKIDIYCAHTNLDKAIGGTTDTLIDCIFNNTDYNIKPNTHTHEYLRFIELKSPIKIEEFSDLLKNISNNARIVNNKNKKYIQNVAFCAGSGAEFINDAKKFGADCLVTGDLKFHTALDSEIVLYDIGHFESEIQALSIFEKLLSKKVNIVRAKENSPFSKI